MSREPFDKDAELEGLQELQELEELEKDIGMKFEKVEDAPLRTEFKDELKTKLAKKLGQGKRIKADSSTSQTFNGGRFKTWGNRKAIIAASLVIILLTAAFWGIYEVGFTPNTVQAADVTIQALTEDKLGVETDTAFLLTSKEPLAEKVVEESLRVSPEFAFSLDKQDNGRGYQIIPKEPLKPNTIYTLAFDPSGIGKENQSWAFQTKSQFQVIRTLPANENTHVPVDTGIEITFTHENYEIDKIKDYFTISPAVEGTFEKHKKTLAFVPKALQPSTIYTVNLKKGLPLAETTESLQDDCVFQFETAPLDQDRSKFRFDMDTGLTEFSLSDKPVFSVYLYQLYSGNQLNTADLPVHIDLYRYPDHLAFQDSLAQRDQIPRWAYYSYNGYREKLNPQYRMAEYDTKFLEVSNYNHMLIFPEKLEKGYYTAEVKAGEAIRQVWFQVSDLSVYMAQGEESTLVWANDLETKKPAENMEVTIPNKSLAVKGDATGAVLIKQRLTEDKWDYALVKSGNKEMLLALQAWQGVNAKDTPRAMDYWKYLYLDRELYQPEDTVNFWGVLSPRGKGDGTKTISKLKEVTVELIGGDIPYYYEGQNMPPIITQKVSVKDQTYMGQIKLPVVKPGYYYLNIKSDDLTLLSRAFKVETYKKPSYKLSLTSDKRAIFEGEKVNFQAETTFFEGTPVPGIELSYTTQGQSQAKTVKTNEQGLVNFTYKGTMPDYDYASYHYVNMNVNAVLPETGEIYTFSPLYVFKSKVYLTGEAKRQSDTFTLTAKLSTVDLTKVNEGEQVIEENFLQEPVKRSPVKVSLYQEVWTKIEAGQRYDFISKKVVKNYNYNYTPKYIKDITLQTDDKGQITYSGQLESEDSYYLELSAQDQGGNSFKRRIYIGGRSNSPDYQYYYLKAKTGASKPGEQVELTMMVNDKEVESQEASMLFYRGQRMISSYDISDKSTYQFLFEEEHIPNINVYGVYFDGLRYHETYAYAVTFAQDSKELAVKIKTDKTVYGPGGQVKLELQVTDVNDNPVKAAQVNLNLVDEALFSLRDQNVNFLNSLYSDQLYFPLRSKKTHDYKDMIGGAEQGGEGGVERNDFRDTVLFTTLKTDGEGKGTVEFQLPDNLTSWRVTYHAFTADLQAGSGTTKIPVKLPFFVEVIANETYLEGDSPIILLRAFGEKLKSSDPVAYAVKLKNSLGEDLNLTEKGVAFSTKDLKLPQLKAGDYTLTVTAVGSNLTDTLTKKFKVAASFQERTLTSQETLAEGMKVAGSPVKPTQVIFSDIEKSQYLRGLYSLAWNNGSRLEQKLAGREALALIGEYFPEEKIILNEDERNSLLNYQKFDGGISILPYGESELALSAMVASSTTGVFDERALAGYFYSILEKQAEGEDLSLCYLGLAALKKPVLLSINDYLKEENLSASTKINLALALLELGDGAYAQKVYQELKGAYSEDLGLVMRINVGRDQDEIIQATTQMAILAARLNQPEKNKLYQYLLENHAKETLNHLEQIQILKYNLKFMPSSPVSFTYELQGQKVKKTLQEREIFKLILLPEDLKNIRFSQIEGKIGIVSQYSLPIKEGETGNSQDLKISRSYRVKANPQTAFDRADLVEIVINYTIGDKAPDGLYEIVDVLPAGLAHISRPYSYQEQSYTSSGHAWDYPAEVNGQRLTFQIGKNKTVQTIKYLARVVSPGKYRCEAPLISNIENNGIYASGSESNIDIK